MTIKTEILIIGAGPAGCTAALSANFFGKKTVVIDRAIFPRDKVCGDGLLLNEINNIFGKIGLDFEKIIGEKKAKRHETFMIKSGNKQFEYQVNFSVIKRLDFDNLLWERLTVYDIPKFGGVDIKQIIKKENGYELTGEIKGKKSGIVVEAKYVIAADGYSSYVRRNHFKDLKFKKRIASRYYFCPEKENSFSTSLIFDEEVVPGYFWAFRMNDNSFNTGVYLAEKSTQNIFEVHNYFMNKYFKHSIPKKEFSTWPIPFNTEFSGLIRQNMILTGDAAGLCDMLFGHGVDNAVISGFLAIESICQAEEKKFPYPLSEIYRYKLSRYLFEPLSLSEKTYGVLKESKENFLVSLEAFLKQITQAGQARTKQELLSDIT